MNIYNMNLVKLKEECIKSKTKFDPSFQITNPTTFLTQALVVFAHVTLVRVDGIISMKATIDALPTKITTPNGFITKDNFKALIVLLYYINRSFFIRKMIDEPTLGSFTPLFMYAHKLYHNVPYQEWDKKDPLIHFALGKFLEDVMKNAPKERIDIKEHLVSYRQIALTYLSGKKKGKMEGLLAYKMPLNLKLQSGGTLYKKVSYMLLQTWICNAAVRDSAAMILDPWNWDLVPTALDAIEARDFSDEVTYARDL